MTIPHFSDSKKGVYMMKSVLKWNLLLTLTDKGIAVFYYLFFSLLDSQIR